MPDITMCDDQMCMYKTDCYRFTATANPYRQSYFAMTPRVGILCHERIQPQFMKGFNDDDFDDFDSSYEAPPDHSVEELEDADDVTSGTPAPHRNPPVGTPVHVA